MLPWYVPAIVLSKGFWFLAQIFHSLNSQEIPEYFEVCSFHVLQTRYFPSSRVFLFEGPYGWMDGSLSRFPEVQESSFRAWGTCREVARHSRGFVNLALAFFVDPYRTRLAWRCPVGMFPLFAGRKRCVADSPFYSSVHMWKHHPVCWKVRGGVQRVRSCRTITWFAYQKYSVASQVDPKVY